MSLQGPPAPPTDLNPASLPVRLHVWGVFPLELQVQIAAACGVAWKHSSEWSDQDLQPKIKAELERAFGDGAVDGDVKLSDLGVAGSKAEIDAVIRGASARVLLHLAGHKTPRHEKELLECISVSHMDPFHTLAVFVVCTTNQLILEGRRTSFDYCKGALLRLAEPALTASLLAGILIVGLPTPSRHLEIGAI